MSARRIRVIARNQNRVPGRRDVVTIKKEERHIRDQHRREKKIESYLADDENFPSFSTQLGKLGLQLRDIPGDGNCLFRAFGDQFEGHCRNHYRFRFEIANFMSEHREEFEPFIEDDIPFDRYIKNLSTIGTYAGNDAIVAFARLYQTNVVIHQLNAPFLLIQGPKTSNSATKQIHISYHNGDHYSSVRKLGDNTESPANIKIKVGDNCQTKQDKYSTAKTNGEINDDIPKCGRVVSAVRNIEIIEQEIMAATGCNDLTLIHEAFYDCDNDVDSAIAQILQIMPLSDSSNGETSSLASQRTSTDSGVFTGSNSPVSNHVRVNSYGGSSGYDSISSNGGALPKLQKQVQMNGKQRKEAKKLEKKKRAEERHKLKFNGGMKTQLSDDEDVHTVVAKDMAMMRI